MPTRSPSLRAAASRLLLALALAALAGCSAESPFSLQGKPKLAGPRCGPAATCPEERRP